MASYDDGVVCYHHRAPCVLQERPSLLLAFPSSPSAAMLSRRTFADTASPPENVRVRRVVQTRAILSAPNRLTHQD